MSIIRRIESLERGGKQWPNIDEIPQRKIPPSEKELRALQRELSMPESVFVDLFGVH
jgi:hypothetical protein